MANKKISELVTVTGGAIDGDEWILVVDNPTTSPATRKISYDEFVLRSDSSAHTFAGTTTFDAAVTLKTTLNVEGITTLSAAVNMLTTLSVSGNADFRGAVSVSGALNALTTMSVSGNANFMIGINVSATASVGALTVGGFQEAGWHKLGSASGATASHFGISGTWTNYKVLMLDVTGKGQTTSTNFILNLYTDGGTTPLMTYALVAAASATASAAWANFMIYGANADTELKVVVPQTHFFGVATQGVQTRSATQTTVALNAIYISIGATTTTATMSSAHVTLYGLLK